MRGLKKIFENMIESIDTDRMDLLPSEWAEQKRVLTSDVSTLTGKYKYSVTPYLREIIDSLSPYHPAKIIAVMKGSQIGFTEGVIVNGILWMIANSPGNCMALSGDELLNREMIESRLDQGIQSCGIQELIRPNTIRKRNQRTGDTSKSKEYAGGRLFGGGIQSIDKLSHQRSIKYGFFDDWEMAPIADREQGNLFSLLQQRFKTAAKSMKQFYSSTPETRPSNIESVYKKGDQRKWHVPCPKCGAYIEIIWHKVIDGDPVGVFFEKDEHGNLVKNSIGYICQECGQFFKERHKYEMNMNGIWVPSCKPSQEGFYSYYINSLTGPPNSFTWTDYAIQWLDIYKGEAERKSQLKVFINQVLGQPWEERKIEISSKKLALNTRDYEIGIVPNKLSKSDGNGMIILLTCACDLNGPIDDARLDYEVVAHSENGSTYRIDQGSIGTYQPGRKPDEERDYWSYKIEKPNNVWDYFWNEIIQKEYHTDEGKIMKILSTGIDTGWATHFAYSFIDQYPFKLLALKGDTEDKFTKFSQDSPTYKYGRERANLYILEGNKLKDELVDNINLRWTEGNPQPPGFMNFPRPTSEKFTSKYFDQFEAETKILEENDDGDPIGWKWTKKSNMSQNHFWDCAYYNIAVRNIISDRILKEAKEPKGNWSDFVRIVKSIAE